VSVTHLLRRSAAAITLVALIAPAGALAAKHHKTPKPTRAEINKALHQSKDLWATVNICDTVTHPDAIGVRASMPGTGMAGEMWMRFRVQFYTAATNTWSFVETNGDSGWVKVGSAKYRVKQTGYTWQFMPPDGGGFWTMRGVVSYQWRAGKKVVYRAKKNATHGHSNAAGGDPPGTSLGLCVIK
jgi:hypothetical protein